MKTMQFLKNLKNPALRSRPLSVGLFAVCAAVWLCALAARANLLVNGSFETPDVPSGSVLFGATPTGWTTTGPSNNHMFDNPLDGAGGWPDGQDGRQYAALLGSLTPTLNSGLSQVFTVAAAGDYVLSWFDSAYLGVVGAPYGVSIIGSPLFSVFGSPLGATDWHERSWEFTLNPGTYSLAFRPTTLGVTLLDNVSLIQKPPGGSTVPDAASTWPMMGLACGSLAVLLRRRERNAR